MAFEGLVACICEGGAERTIIEILLENNLLKFSKEQLLDGEILGKRDRSAKNFEKNHLRKQFDEKITIIRILDSRREEFLLSKLYREKIEVINYITAPEIEMLIILNENKNKEFQKVKAKMKASEFCENILGFDEVKSPQFIKDYFRDTDILVNVLNKYKGIKFIPPGEQCLADLLK